MPETLHTGASQATHEGAYSLEHWRGNCEGFRVEVDGRLVGYVDSVSLESAELIVQPVKGGRAVVVPLGLVVEVQPYAEMIRAGHPS